MVCAVACCGVFLGYWPDACTFSVSFTVRLHVREGPGQLFTAGVHASP